MAKKVENADLEALQNKDTVIRVGDEDIHIKAFTFGQLLKALKYLANIGGNFSGENVDDGAIMRAFAYNTDDVLGLLMLATGKNKEFFDELSAEQGIDMAIAAWKVNQDFFVQKLAPKIQELSNSQDQDKPKEKAVAKTGLTSSKD